MLLPPPIPPLPSPPLPTTPTHTSQSQGQDHPDPRMTDVCNSQREAKDHTNRLQAAPSATATETGTPPPSLTRTHTHTHSAELFALSATPHSLLSTDHEGTYVNILPEMSHFIPSSVKRLHKSINVLWGILTWAALLPGRELKLHTSVLCFSKCQ